jgi:hypothetical protein
MAKVRKAAGPDFVALASRSSRAVLVAMSTVSLTGCFASLPVATPEQTSLGTVTLAAGALDTDALVPMVCLSGEREVFNGADFLDTRRGLVLRLIVTPDGTGSIRVFDAAHPLETGLLFGREDCSLFELSLERTGWRINDVVDLRVSLAVGCRKANGDFLQATLTAGHCH